jgi:hypothetical protein
MTRGTALHIGLKSAAGIATALLLLASSGCSPFGVQSSTLAATVTECVLPDDQSQTLIGSWGKLPIPLAIESGSGGIDSDEVTAILAAADTWNAHFESALGLTVFDTGSGDSVRITTATSADPCSTVVLNASGSFTGAVPILKHSDWPYSSAKAIAFTTHCTPQTLNGGGTLGTLKTAVLDVNSENFFVDGTVKHDLQTIVGHELGHVLGLDHSCEDSSSEGIPGCTSAQALYQNALMYPKFGYYSDYTGIIRHELNSNDQGRANCLYESMRTE